MQIDNNNYNQKNNTRSPKRRRQTKIELQEANILNLRQCPKCLQRLSEDAYQPSNWRKGVGNPCRECARKISKEIRKRNGAAIRIRESKYWHSKTMTEKREIMLRQQYKLSLQDLDNMFKRQYGLCLICRKELPTGIGKGDNRFHVDHDHSCCPNSSKTCGKCVRGLLCHKCNTASGLLDESPEAIRRMIAYLDRDPNLIMVYIAGSLKNERIPQIGNLLRQNNYDVMDEWFTPGERADENWQKYEGLRGRSFSEALRGRAATNIFLFDKSYIDLCDIFVSVLPSGRSAALEMGYVKGCGKPACYFTDGSDPERYDIMPNFADAVIQSEDDLLSWIRQVSPVVKRELL